MIHDCEDCTHEPELEDLRIEVSVYDPNRNLYIYKTDISPDWTFPMHFRMGVPIIRPNGRTFHGISVALEER